MPAPKGNKFAKNNPGGGRKTLYKPEYAEQAFKYSLLGADNKKMAEFFGVGETTIMDWQTKHHDFSEAVKGGKDKADSEIVNSLYQRAKGFTTKETDIKVIDGKIVKTTIIKQYPPDTAAAIIWLKNRQRQNWRDRQAEDDAPPVIVTVNVTKEEQVQIANNLRNEMLG